jgi:hypothetical protein
MNGQYILVNDVPTPEPDLKKWGMWFETADRRVALTQVGDSTVSTVFLALDHNFGGGTPILYETMVFGADDRDELMRRYATVEEAQEGHESVVKALIASQGEVDAAL